MSIFRTRGRHVDDAALVVDRDLAPVVRAADGLPRVVRPRVVAELARPRDGVERPDELAVRTSKARMSPGADPYPRLVADPRMIRFSNTRPGMRLCWLIVAGSRSSPSRRSTRPSVPNDVIGLPVCASISCSRFVRAEDAAAGRGRPRSASSSCRELRSPLMPSRSQSCLPVAASSATSESSVPRAVDDAADDERIEIGLARPGTSRPPAACRRWLW